MKPLLVILAIALAACGDRRSENSASCGLAILASANGVLQQLQIGSKLLTEVPADMKGTVPARVVGYGTSSAIIGEGTEGIVAGYQGEGFPALPGFGLILVEDSTDTFKGILVFESEAPMGLPALGGISDGRMMLPLYGTRVTWSAVSTPRCPLFREDDSTTVG